MSLEILEKFILEIVPDRAKIPAHTIFVEMRDDPIKSFAQGFNFIFDDLKREGSIESAAAVNGLMTGIALVYADQRSNKMESILEEYIAQQKLKRGENVLNFMDRLVERKR